MAYPTTATIKRLFAVSKNCCAFPKCNLPLVDHASGKVTGRICHIAARQQGGPRYNVSQTEEERHQFENLILMCPIHHDVIDSDSESYTVDRLLRIKSDHEAVVGSGAEISEPNDEIVAQLIASATNNNIHSGSVIVSQNQMGGQIAHSIQNFGRQTRQFSLAAENHLLSQLRQYPPETVDLVCIMGDVESHQLAVNLKRVLELAGWGVNGVNQALFGGPVIGVHVEVPSTKPSLEILLQWLDITGLNSRGVQDPRLPVIKIIIGANL